MKILSIHVEDTRLLTIVNLLNNLESLETFINLFINDYFDDDACLDEPFLKRLKRLYFGRNKYIEKAKNYPNMIAIGSLRAELEPINLDQIQYLHLKFNSVLLDRLSALENNRFQCFEFAYFYAVSFFKFSFFT